MSRDLPSAVATAIAATVVPLAFFAEFEFASGPLRMWNGKASKTWDGKTWTGGGDLVGISPIEETTDTGAAGLTFTLSGLDSALLALALADDYRNRACRLWLAILDASEAVVDAYMIFAGRMDVMRIVPGAKTSTISLQVENRLVDLRRPRSMRYTDAEQQRLFPGDRGLEYLAKLAEKPLYWGVPPTGTASPQYSAPARSVVR